MLGIESDIRIESVDASLYVRKEKRGTKSIRNEATAVEKREEIIYVTISLSLSLSILPNRRRRRRAAAHYG